MSSPPITITESQSFKRLHAIQSVVNDEPGCHSVRGCFPTFVATGDSNDSNHEYSEAVDELENIAGDLMDGIFVVGNSQRAGVIHKKMERVFSEQNIDGRPRLLFQEPNNDGSFKAGRIYLDNKGDKHTLPDGVKTIASILYVHCQVKDLVEYLTSHLYLSQFVIKGCIPSNLERNTRVFMDDFQTQHALCQEEENEEYRQSLDHVSGGEESGDDTTGKSASLF
jgi:hypothetical protein